ncbi:MAG: TIGR01777 family oxidoreductase [Deltaproteobacteria bacterium]|nr:TIGR01777 family oxidoreductase [Deltaproteobacteria bacterium]
MRARFKKESFFSVPKQELFAFHERDDAFSLLTPASENIEVGSTASTLAPSDEVVRFAVRFGPLRLRFENVHTVYEPFDLFVDEQRRGLFTEWRHEHRFEQAGWDGDPASMLSDEILYSHPLLPLLNPFVRHRLRRLFEYRHHATAREVHSGRRKRTDTPGEAVVITGATGLIGRRIAQILVEGGSRVIALARNVEQAQKQLGDQVSCVHWDFTEPDRGGWKRCLSEADAVIHLAGTPLFKQRWTDGFKREMEQSRTLGTRQLVDAIIASQRKPRVFISASALGYYGMDPDGVVDETASPADDLLARICVNWENEARRLDAHGVRTVQMRIGIVLSTESGALKELLPLFRMGMGGTMGDPRPHINWVHIEDIARMLAMALSNEKMRGAYNAIAPNPVSNRDFAKAIARALRRPALLGFPLPVLRIILGEAGQYASGGPRVRGEKIQASGYRCFFSDLDQALSNLLA